MSSQRIHLLIFVLGVATLTVQSIVLHRRGVAQLGSTSTLTNDATAASTRNGIEAKPSESTSQTANAGAAADYEPMKRPERLRVLAAHSAFQLIQPQSLELKEVVRDLLELTPEQANVLQDGISTLLDDVRAEELKNAYVRVKSDGSQEVVVAPFDRGPLLRKFRETLAPTIGSDEADFCAREALYDSTLAVGNKEVRIYTLRGPSKTETMAAMSGYEQSAQYAERMKDRERLMISRGVYNRNSLHKPEWEGEAGPPFGGVLPSTTDYGPRYRHLQEAMARLPRKTE